MDPTYFNREYSQFLLICNVQRWNAASELERINAPRQRRAKTYTDYCPKYDRLWGGMTLHLLELYEHVLTHVEFVD